MTSIIARFADGSFTRRRDYRHDRCDNHTPFSHYWHLLELRRYLKYTDTCLSWYFRPSNELYHWMQMTQRFHIVSIYSSKISVWRWFYKRNPAYNFYNYMLKQDFRNLNLIERKNKNDRWPNVTGKCEKHVKFRTWGGEVREITLGSKELIFNIIVLILVVRASLVQKNAKSFIGPNKYGTRLCNDR